MKILFVITRADTIGGAQVHVRDLAINLQKNNHQVLILTGCSGLYTENLSKNNIKYISCPNLQNNLNPIQDGKAINFFVKIIQNFQPDLISTHSSKAGILGRIASKITNIPCLFTAHGWAFTGGVPQPKRLIYQTIEQLTEPLANKIICVSEHDREIGIKVGMSAQRLLTIHNGMPDIPEQLKANPSQSNPIKIVMIARFEQQKDHVTLLKALPNIDNIELNLIGDGPNLESIKNLANNLGLSNRVNFLGYCENIPEILSQSQIFVLISNWEGFPRTTLEAMRAGIPVIVSDVGGAAEAVIEGVTGYVVPKGDVITLNQRLTTLVYNLELRQQMGDQARKRYEQEFTFNIMFEKTFNIYQQVIANKN